MNRLRIRRAVLAVTAAVALMSLQSMGAEVMATVSVTDSYVRAVPPGQPNSAAFMKIFNQSDTDQAIIGATSPAAKVVELHTHMHDGEVMKMRQIEQIVVPAQGETILEPGGLHLMLLGLNEDLEEGGDVALTLIFGDGSQLLVSAPVVKLKMHMGMKKDMMMNDAKPEDGHAQ